MSNEYEENDDDLTMCEDDLIVAFHSDMEEFTIVMPEDGRLTRYQHQKLEEIALLSEPSFVLKFVLWIELKFKLLSLYIADQFKN